MILLNIERCKFNTTLKIQDFISSHVKDNENYTIDITDHNVNDKEILFLKNLPHIDKIWVTDTNWFGGIWTLDEFLKAESKLDEVVNFISSKNLSPFEKFILAYHFASNRPYIFAPKGSPFQACRSYVDVINKGYCVCVGYSTPLKRLCDKLGIECAVQGCLAKDKFGKIINHANNLIYLKDVKYQIDGIFYCDPRMDCLNFANVNGVDTNWKFNFLAIPITEIGKILIKVWDDDTIIEMNDFQSLYYSRKISQSDKQYLSKFFSQSTLQNMMSKKYCKHIEDEKLFLALKNIGLDSALVNKIKDVFYSRKNLFFSDNLINKSHEEWNKRLDFAEYLLNYVKHAGRKDAMTKMDCATFVRYVYSNIFDVDIMQDGFGKSWTGKILTSSLGTDCFIDEKATLKQKINFIDTKCKIGDILFFHRQSVKENKTTQNNWYPGHCGIYLGNHKYIDARLTTRGNTAIVDIENDNYMENFIGFKDVISSLNNKLDNISENTKNL